MKDLFERLMLLPALIVSLVPLNTPAPVFTLLPVVKPEALNVGSRLLVACNVMG